MVFAGLLIGGDHVNGGPLSHDIPVGPGIKEITVSFGQKPKALEGHKHRRVKIAIHPAGQNKIKVFVFYIPDGISHGNKSRGAGGINHVIGPVKPEIIGDPA